MRFNHNLHLAYCTNVHRGESWAETFAALVQYTLAVRNRVSPDAPYAIGLRLSDLASRELSEGANLGAFRKWLEKNRCYIFTINGFPFGNFHGRRVKENVYRPDWTTDERLNYTNRLFELLAELLPEGVEGSVSTLPGSFKEFIQDPAQEKLIRQNLWRCLDHMEKVGRRADRSLHLGLEPEPLGLFETSAETVRFFDQLQAERPRDDRWKSFLGVNYDACHLAVEFEEPADALKALQQHGIRISKLHLSSAIKTRPTAEAREQLTGFAEDVYLHQVVSRQRDGTLKRYRDLDQALQLDESGEEWRVHFHVPLHATGQKALATTSDHLLGVLDVLQREPTLCQHLEMETYTWEVLPPELKNRDVVDQLACEYDWTLRALATRGFRPLNQ